MPRMMAWLLRLSSWYLLAVPLIAASGPLYIETVVDDRHLVVITRDGESLLLERRPDEDPAPGGMTERSHVAAAGRHIFASERDGGILLLDGEPRQTAWVVARSLGWNPRKTIGYWLLIVLGGVMLTPLVVWVWRRFAAATDSTVVRYSHGPPPELRPGELEAVALPRGWRLWATEVSSAGLGMLGIIALSLLGLMVVVAPGNVDPIRRPTPGVVAMDLVATSVGLVVVMWLFAGYASSLRQLWWSASRAVRFAMRPRTRTTATLRHGGTITIESGSDSATEKLHVLVYAFTAHHRGHEQTYVVSEAVARPSDLAVDRRVELEYVTGDPSVVRRRL